MARKGSVGVWSWNDVSGEAGPPFAANDWVA
eukprot:CAMPEP_0177687656 /NCGR_PEP_ID=MMETSP0447-20121125/34243_1 /TAXON_ID=0 /ORGANISM="Stygamoeba regulata, Strain BSH-02190019" /LENGTH=30 /DNA_ID= /DNA_START= /DNA_END= /DNA_ORIENTATION=